MHTDAIKENIIPKSITKEQAAVIYAHETDLLNMALFSITAKQWKARQQLPKRNIRGQATIEQLLVLAKMNSC